MPIILHPRGLNFVDAAHDGQRKCELSQGERTRPETPTLSQNHTSLFEAPNAAVAQLREIVRRDLARLGSPLGSLGHCWF